MPYTVSLVNAHPGGYRPRAYGLLLTWLDSTDPNTVSVNVYRSLVSGGPYTLITNVLAGVQTYTDFNVVSQVPYFYVLTEINNSSLESGFSSEQTGTPGPIA